MEKRTSDSILTALKELVESKKVISREHWLEAAFDLNLFRIEEAALYNSMHQKVAEKKLDIIRKQNKPNVAAADVVVEASDEYRFMKDQEAKLYSIDEFIRISKKNAEINF